MGATGFGESVTGGGGKEETHRQVRFGGGLETFSSLLEVSPRARSGSSRRSRSQRSRHGRRGRNSLRGVGDHANNYVSTRGQSREEGKGRSRNQYRFILQDSLSTVR